jgi:hypothetical protein
MNGKTTLCRMNTFDTVNGSKRIPLKEKGSMFFDIKTQLVGEYFND